MKVRLMKLPAVGVTGILTLLLCCGSTVFGQNDSAESTDAGATVSAEDDGTAQENHADDEDHADHDHDDGEHDEGEHADGEGAIHLDNDPTHGNISDATWELLDFRTDMAFFSAVVFLLLLAGLWAAAWKPIMEGLEKREDTIAGNMAQAEKASAEAEAKLAAYEAKLAEANEEAATIVADARKDAEAAGQKLVAAAQEDAAKLKERAAVDIETAKRVALGELADQSTDIAMLVAQRVVGREVKAEDHQGLIQELLQKLPSNN